MERSRGVEDAVKHSEGRTRSVERSWGGQGETTSSSVI